MFSGLDTEAYDRSYSDIMLIRRIAGYFAPYRKRLWGVVFFVCVVSLSAAGQPLLVSRSVGALEGQISTFIIVLVTALMIIFGAGIWLANWVRRRMTIRLIVDVVAAMRRDAFTASINHDMAFFDEFSSGRIISRITTDTNEFAEVVQLIVDITSQVLLVFILLVVLFYISWQLTLVMLALTPIVFILTFPAFGKMVINLFSFKQ